MTELLAALLGLFTGSSSVGALWVWRSRDPNSKVRRLIRHRYVVTLKGGEGAFCGTMVEMYYDAFVFESCVTVPTGPGDALQEIPGRVTVESDNVAYLQEMTE